MRVLADHGSLYLVDNGMFRRKVDTPISVDGHALWRDVSELQCVGNGGHNRILWEVCRPVLRSSLLSSSLAVLVLQVES